MVDGTEDEVMALRAEVERLRAELRATQAMHEATIESLPFDFWARERDGYCVSMNSATRRHWGDLLHKRPEDHGLPPDVLATWLANNARALAGEIVRGDVEYVVNGDTRHVHNILAPIRQGDEIVGSLGVNIDLTDLRRLERRLREHQRLETIGLLAGGVAHDINNIVMVILTVTALARRHVTPSAELAEDFATIETASRRAAEICTELLAFAGRRQLARELIDLDALVADTAKLLHSTLPHDHDLVIERSAAVLPVEADSAQLRTLVMNLILNASEAIAGPGRIRIGLAAASPAEVAAFVERFAIDPARPYAVLTVSDTGSGMTEDTLERIFEPFFTTKARGRGLGLAAALGTVRAHSGALAVDSVAGHGSTFRVILPRAARALEAAAPSRGTAEWRGSGTVLIVDDHEGVAAATAAMTRELGFDAIVATSGSEALSRLGDLPAVAVVLLDLMMPGLDGRATLDRIRERHPTLPVVLMSGFHDLAEPPPGTPFLRKPFGFAELTTTLREAIAARAHAR